MIPDRFPSELRDILLPGNIVRIWYDEGNPNNELRHIRAIVDEVWIVYRVWGKRKRRWFYDIDSWFSFYLAWRDGFVKIEKRGSVAS